MSSSDYIKFPALPPRAPLSGTWNSDHLYQFARHTFMLNAPQTLQVGPHRIFGSAEACNAVPARLSRSRWGAPLSDDGTCVHVERKGLPSLVVALADIEKLVADRAKGFVFGETRTSAGGPARLHNLPKLKPFDLEAAKAGAPLVTRDGRSARFVAHVPEAESGLRVLVYVEGACGVSEYSETGTARAQNRHGDLSMAPKPKRKKYVNLYKDMSYSVWNDEATARKYGEASKDHARFLIAVEVEVDDDE